MFKLLKRKERVIQKHESDTYSAQVYQTQRNQNDQNLEQTNQNWSPTRRKEKFITLLTSQVRILLLSQQSIPTTSQQQNLKISKSQNLILSLTQIDSEQS